MLRLPNPPATALLPNRARWDFRRAFPGSLTMPLGAPFEYWRPVSELPGLAELRPYADRWTNPKYELTQRHLEDVIDAAGFVEYAAARVHEAIDEVAPFVPERPPGPTPEYGYSLSDPTLRTAYMEWANLVVWVRAVRDRVQRTWWKQSFGLLPALAPSPVAERVAVLLAEFRQTVADDAARLAAYALHAGPIPRAASIDAQIVDGRLVLLIPDRTTAGVTTPFALTYEQQRSVDTFTDEALHAVIAFVDGTLDAFEEYAPARVRKQAPSGLHS